MRKLSFSTANVFTRKAFAGNPLAIVHDADGLSTPQMQTMAREFNLPETIFIQTPDDEINTAKVRIFFPTDEIPFAGHPTIGCAIYLAELAHDPDTDFETEIRLEEVAGLVPVKVVRKNRNIDAQFIAPVIPFQNSTESIDITSAAKALGLEISEIGIKNHPIAGHQGGPTFLYVPLSYKSALSKSHACEPQCTQITKQVGATGLYCYCFDQAKNEIDARMFAPAAGIPEDPATGSATALLASQLKEAGALREGLNSFQLRQGYDMGRPSDLDLEVDFVNSEITAVRVAGSSIAISTGNMLVPKTN